MFTGLVEALAEVREISPDGPGVRLTVASESAARAAAIGDSIAVNGCCLTVVKVSGAQVSFEAGDETLKCTSLGKLVVGDRVNLETSMRLNDQIGGHLVAGHVDAVGAVESREDDAQWSTMWFSAPRRLMPQMASKGSIAVDGVSLTLVDVHGDRFSVAVIPHTLQVTTLGFRRVGDLVNLETDLLAKYVERQLAWKA